MKRTWTKIGTRFTEGKQAEIAQAIQDLNWRPLPCDMDTGKPCASGRRCALDTLFVINPVFAAGADYRRIGQYRDLLLHGCGIMAAAA